MPRWKPVARAGGRSGRRRRATGGGAAAALLAATLLAACAPACRAWGGAGEAAFAFARLDPEPVGRALAGAHAASVTGAAALGWNVAGLARGREGGAVLAHAAHPAGTSWEWAAAAVPLPGRAGCFGAAAGVWRSGALTGYASDGADQGQFDPGQWVVTVAHAIALGSRGSIGCGVEWLHDDGGPARALDACGLAAGARWRCGRVELGLAGAHLGPRVSAGGERLALPALVRGGAGISPARGLRLDAAVETGAAHPWRALAAIAWRPVVVIEGLAGARCDLEEAGNDRLRPAFGLAVHARLLTVTYGFTAAEIGAAHQVALAIPLGPSR